MKIIRKILILIWQKITSNKLLSILLFLIIIKGVVWAGLVPVWQGWDENYHYKYIEYIAEKNTLPPQDKLFTSQEDQIVNKLISNAPIRQTPKFSQTQTGIGENLLNQNINRAPASPITAFSAQSYPPLYYLMGAGIYKIFYSTNFLVRFFAIRILLIFLGILTVWLSYKIAFEVSENKLFSFTVATLVSFQPLFTLMSSTINNDNLLNLAFVWLTYLGIRELKSQSSTKSALWIGIATSLGILAKPQAAIMIPILIFIYLINFVRKRNNFKNSLKYLAIALGIIFLTTGWWLIRNKIIYHGWFGYQASGTTDTQFAHLSIWEYLKFIYGTRLRFVLGYFWAQFAWTNNVVDNIYQNSLNWLVKLSFVGTIIYFVTSLYKKCVKKIKTNNPFIKNLYLYIFLAANLIILDLFYVYLFYNRLVTTAKYIFPAQGRYYFPVLGILAIFFIIGIQTWLPKKYHPSLYLFLSLGIIFYNFICLFQYIIPRYYL
ncbi:MAG TPA: glycosyltransferase family 39 protein [Patescibacteria group bacterium]|nr:glycosyltransferase family 39 protein [Patescibacteria group bacterium]